MAPEQHLMEAADDLLSALVQLLVAFDVELPAGCPQLQPTDDNHWDVARAAIRKALNLPQP